MEAPRPVSASEVLAIIDSELEKIFVSGEDVMHLAKARSLLMQLHDILEEGQDGGQDNRPA